MAMASLGTLATPSRERASRSGRAETWERVPRCDVRKRRPAAAAAGEAGGPDCAEGCAQPKVIMVLAIIEEAKHADDAKREAAADDLREPTPPDEE